MESPWQEARNIVQTASMYAEDNKSSSFMKALDNATNPSSFYMFDVRDPLYVVIPVTIIYVIIFITGVVGNVSTCIVISRNKSMHTATNYYLFSLAISDLLLLISGLPQEMYSIWSRYPYIFGEAFCVLRGLAAETSANATVLTITAFTIERYVAICHPFLSHTMSKLTRAIKLILMIWLIALAFAVPQAIQFGLVDNMNVVICTQKIVLFEHSFEISTILFFVMPMTLITVLYALIGFRLRSSTMMRERGPSRTSRTGAAGWGNNASRRGPGQSSRRVLKMLVAVVVAFFICWAPFHVQRLVAIHSSPDSPQESSPQVTPLYVITTYISGVLYYFSTTINPVLYHIMSNKFREAFKETLARWWGGSERRLGGSGGGGPEGGQGGGAQYSALSRRQQHAAHRHAGGASHDSTDYSGNSVRDESLPCLGENLSGVRNGRRGGSGTTATDLSTSLPSQHQLSTASQTSCCEVCDSSSQEDTVETQQRYGLQPIDLQKQNKMLLDKHSTNCIGNQYFLSQWKDQRSFANQLKSTINLFESKNTCNALQGSPFISRSLIRSPSFDIENKFDAMNAASCAFKNEHQCSMVKLHFDEDNRKGIDVHKRFSVTNNSDEIAVHRRKKTKLWYILKCIAFNNDHKSQMVDQQYNMQLKKKFIFAPCSEIVRLTVENETQTDVDFVVHNNSRDSESDSFKDELTSYMEEIHRRELICDRSKFSM